MFQHITTTNQDYIVVVVPNWSTNMDTERRAFTLEDYIKPAKCSKKKTKTTTTTPVVVVAAAVQKKKKSLFEDIPKVVPKPAAAADLPIRTMNDWVMFNQCLFLQQKNMEQKKKPPV